MATQSLAYLSSTSQSPIHSYKRNNRLVTEGYDLQTAKHWYRVDFGQVHEFYSSTEMRTALDAEFAPKFELPDLPQLPAQVRQQKSKRRILAEIRAMGKVLPTRGVIYLPATMSPVPEPPNLASEIQAVVTSKKAWSAGETVWIANRAAFLKETNGLIALDYIPPKRNKFTPPVPVGKVGFLSIKEGWKLGLDWMSAVKKAERGLAVAA